METFAFNIENLLQKKLCIYSELTKLLEDEKDYIINMDVSELWKASSRKRVLASDIENVRNSIIFLLNDKKIDHDLDLKNFDLQRLIAMLPISAKLKAELETIKIAIEGKKNELRQIASSNRKYIQEYLGVIDGVISTITGGARQESYGRKGQHNSGSSPSFYGTRYGRGVSTSLISAKA